MNTIKGIFPKHSFEYDGTHVNVYHANKNEGLPKHNHKYTHATVCCAGKLKVTKENFEMIMTKESQPIVLTAGEWHELEAIEDETVWTNMFASEFIRCDIENHNGYQKK
jgi:quercetin dioxygenase-like cupin family protein